ncbi:MAG TPA: hypothetical protein VFH88_06550 [Candidatus Krumholzibacteria bacterium]|nr:hypothetical protein [Candidatus Krumholzibacteria bacterium]
MRLRLAWIALLACVLAMTGTLACSKKKSAETAANSAATTNEKEKYPATPAEQPLTPDNAPYADTIKSKGFQVVQARRFPAQVDGRRAAVVVYRAQDGSKGGVLYVRGFPGEAMHPVWHWYFGDAAPDSVAALDINRDGLWDVRVYMDGGKTRDFVQDTDFTFGGADRDGLSAMNGASSKPEGLWEAFDSDTSTAWTAPSSGAYLDIPNPLGITNGQLSIRLAGGSRPNKLEIGDGSKTIQSCDLESTAEEQRFQLDPAVKDLPDIRINVEGPGKKVAISELEIH